MITQIDHIALGVEDIEATISFFTQQLNFRVGRRGTHMVSGRPIVFIWDPGTGTKFELIEVEAGKGGVDHFAFRSDDIAQDCKAFSEEGYPPVRGPKRTEPAKMETAHFVAHEGLKIQICNYDEGAEDSILPSA